MHYDTSTKMNWQLDRSCSSEIVTVAYIIIMYDTIAKLPSG